MQEYADDNVGTEAEKVQRQQSAVQSATKVLLNRHSAPTALVLTYLPWLISTSPKHALSVLKVSTVLLKCTRCKTNLDMHLLVLTMHQLCTTFSGHHAK